MKSNRAIRYGTYKKLGNVYGMKSMEDRWPDEFGIEEIVEAIEEEVKPKKEKKHGK